jgi:hypothetical protein
MTSLFAENVIFSTKKIEKDYLALLKMVDSKHPKPHHHPAP